MKFSEYLVSINACGPARDWVGEKTLAQAWAENTNPARAIWLLSFADYRAAVRLAARFARKVLNLVESGDREICEAAIKFAEFWADSPTEENRLAAGAAARAAAGRELWIISAQMRMMMALARFVATLFPARTMHEGSPVDQMRKRMRTFDGGKLVLVSIPKWDGDVMWREFQGGTQSEWMVPCPACGARAPWTLERIRWTQRPRNVSHLDWAKAVRSGKAGAWWECGKCGRVVSDPVEKNEMNSRGEWVAKFPDLKFHFSARGPSLMHRSQSFDGWAIEFLEAHHDLKMGDDAKMATFKQHEEAMPYSAERQRVEEDAIAACAVDLPRGTIPYGARIFVFGCDIQGREIYWQAASFDPVSNSIHFLDYGRAPGTPAEVLPVLARKTYDGRLCHGGFADAGDGVVANQVYAVCASIPPGNWRPIHGATGGQTRGRLWMESPNAEAQHAGRLVLIDVDGVKDRFLGALQAGKISFLRQMASQERFRKLTGESRWKKRLGHDDDHWFDAAIYALALLNAVGWEPGNLPLAPGDSNQGFDDKPVETKPD